VHVIVLTGVVVLSAIAGASFGVAGTSAVQAEDDEQAAVVSIVETMEAAENETRGTVVGAEREGDFGILEGAGEGTPAGVEETPPGAEGGTVDPDDLRSLQYSVDVLLDNGTQLDVSVNAANGSVVEVSEVGEGFLADIFGQDDVPDRPLNLSAMRSAIDAVELAQNETGATETVTEVRLNERDDIEGRDELLVYEVQLETAEGERTTVLVAAFEAEGDVIETEGGTETAETATETAV
jgi:uncharacterized membrane protein YkoI